MALRGAVREGGGLGGEKGDGRRSKGAWTDMDGKATVVVVAPLEPPECFMPKEMRACAMCVHVRLRQARDRSSWQEIYPLSRYAPTQTEHSSSILEVQGGCKAINGADLKRLSFFRWSESRPGVNRFYNLAVGPLRRSLAVETEEDWPLHWQQKSQ